MARPEDRPCKFCGRVPGYPMLDHLVKEHVGPQPGILESWFRLLFPGKPTRRSDSSTGSHKAPGGCDRAEIQPGVPSAPACGGVGAEGLTRTVPKGGFES